VYGEEFGLIPSNFISQHESAKCSKRSRQGGRKVSEQSSSQTSPSRHRKDSVPTKRDRIIHDESEPSTSQYSQKAEDIVKPKDPPPILKYIHNHVRDIFHMPISALVKGAVVLSEELFTEILPAAWELLLETNQETAVSAASLFILASVRAPSCASEIMQRALKHKDPNIRIGAILR
jgi:protein unc-80